MCINAGMDDFLSKPATRNDIAAKLALYFGAQSSDVTCDTPNKSGQGTPVFDTAIYRELQNFFGPDEAHALLEIFVAQTALRLAAMRQAALTSDRSLIKREAHALTSSAASLGFMTLSLQAKVLAADTFKFGVPDLQISLRRLTKAFDEVRASAEDIAFPHAHALP